LSTNTFYSPKHFADGKVPGTLIAKNLMLAYKWGLKTIYYSLIDKVGSKNVLNTQSSSLVAVEPVTIYEDEDCEACKL
jgi:ribonucleoside-diphosphate reductase alpha chain